jgi:uncharacterized protein
VINAPNNRSGHTIHGPDHWLRVQRNARILANRTGAKINVVRLFALFHDSNRINDWTVSGHGQMGAEFAKELCGSAFELSDEELD